MRLDPLFRWLFILYCVEAGVFLVLAPWSLLWDRGCLGLPMPSLRQACLHPVLRGGVSGFGLVHLLWGAHDLDAWLGARRARG
jgi:hypothetical protein